VIAAAPADRSEVRASKWNRDRFTGSGIRRMADDRTWRGAQDVSRIALDGAYVV